MTKVKIRVGDVFTIPLSGDTEVCGQVIGQDAHTYLVVTFRKVTTRGPSAIEDALQAGVDLAGITFDAKLLNGDWPIVGHRPPVAGGRLLFSAGSAEIGTLKIHDYAGSLRRASTRGEASQYIRRHNSSPMTLQRAVQAAHGVGEWKPTYDHFRTYAEQLSAAESMNC